ncbi:MAG: hypothetical protein J7559_21420 [Cohnella sp.]|nr:hypothetical protein [Cohnella sp.]
MLYALLLPRGLSFAAPSPPPVEVFDVKQEKVVHVIPWTEALQTTIVNALNQSPKPYEGVTMNPTGGIVAHFRYPVPVKLDNPIYPQPVSELYLFLEPHKDPLALLFFSKGHKPRVYTLQADAKSLIQSVQPKP